MMLPRRTRLLLGLWLATFAAAVAIDGPVARWVDLADPIPRKSPVKRWIKPAGDFKYLCLLIPVVVVVHLARWRAGLALALASAFSGLLYGTKWAFGRHRPSYQGRIEPYTLDPFTDGLPGVFYAKALSFPSGHACLAFATASCLAALFPRGAVVFYSVAVVVGIERVLEGAHYPSDVVAGAAFGILATRLAMLLCAGWFGPGWLRGASPPATADQPAAPAAS